MKIFYIGLMKKPIGTQISVLKRRISQGDTHSLTVLYDIYFAKLKYYGMQLNHLNEVISIDDAIQDLFLWIATNHEKLNEIDNLEVYLFVSLKKNIYSKSTLFKVKQESKLKYDLHQNLQNIPTVPSVEQDYIESESQQTTQIFAQALLDQLPHNQRQVLYLRNYANLSHKEISEIMNLSEQVVRNYSYRAMLKLKGNNQTISMHVNRVS